VPSETFSIESLTMVMSLLLVSSTVAILTRNFIRIPYTVALVLVGLFIGFAHLIETFHLSKTLILGLFLPPLLFEGALNMDLQILKRKALGVTLLAVGGTLLSTLFVGIVARYVLDLGWLPALLLGAILSPTDPVSALALFREQKVDRDLSTIVEGESVFNDGLGVVLYLILLQGVYGGTVSMGQATQIFVWEVLVGATSGLGLGYLCYRLLGKIEDHLIEVTISILLAFGCYIVAERFHASGVIAVVVSGIIIGNYGQILSMSPVTRLALTHFWEVIAFVINSLLFLLIGIDLDSSVVIRHAGSIVVIFALITIARFFLVWMFALILVALKKPWPKSWRSVIAWGGLKGSIPIALALGLPLTFPNRQDMVSVIFGVVLLSLLLQGLTFKSLLRQLGIGKLTEEQLELETLLGRLLAVNASLRDLEDSRLEGTVPLMIYSKKSHELTEERNCIEHSLEDLFNTSQKLESAYRQSLERGFLRSRLAAIAEGARRGIVSHQTAERLSKELFGSDLTLDCLSDDANQEK
jgi:monovalent cation:H+ antiporter, CPA1 family